MKPTDDEIREIYRSTLDELYDFVARRCEGDRGLTEDITQEAWRQDGLRKVVQSAPAAKSTLRNEPYVGTALPDRFNGQPKRLSACDDGSGGRLT
jgi:hypothetical protein